MTIFARSFDDYHSIVPQIVSVRERQNSVTKAELGITLLVLAILTAAIQITLNAGVLDLSTRNLCFINMGAMALEGILLGFSFETHADSDDEHQCGVGALGMLILYLFFFGGFVGSNIAGALGKVDATTIKLLTLGSMIGIRPLYIAIAMVAQKEHLSKTKNNLIQAETNLVEAKFKFDTRLNAFLTQIEAYRASKALKGQLDQNGLRRLEENRLELNRNYQAFLREYGADKVDPLLERYNASYQSRHGQDPAFSQHTLNHLLQP